MYSKTQTVISLSSGEGEFYAAVKAITMAPGASEMGKDVGVDLKPRVKYDATAGAGIASRRGGGRLDTFTHRRSGFNASCRRAR